MYQNDIDRIVEFYRRGSHYDMVLESTDTGWGSPWVFTPCDIHAVEKASWMLSRIEAKSVRHARRAKLLHRSKPQDEVVIITDLPQRLQSVVRIADGAHLEISMYLTDASLDTLEAIFGPKQSLNNNRR